MDVLRAFAEAAHPRAPAGSSGGGQFVSADAGESGGGAASKDKQDEVRAVQKLLGLKPTGTFTAADAAALRRYQKAHGLLVDGKAGGQTIASLLGEGKRKPGPMTAADKAKLLDVIRGPARKPAAKKKTQSKTSTQAKTADAAKQKTAQKPAAQRAMAHEKVGKTGQGLWGHKGWQLPAYIQHVANDLIATGHSMSQAIQLAVGTIKNWAAGHDGKGNSVSASTQAKAAVALAQWEKLKAKTKVGARRMSTYTRAFPLEEIRRMTAADGAPDGRTVEAYAAVFDTPAEIRDGEGHYREVIDRTAFNKTLRDAQRSDGAWRVGCFYNHGLSIHGTPAEQFSLPLGTPVDIKVEQRGLLTRTRYANTPLADQVLELIDSGAITAQSFTGRIVRSDPGRPAGGRYRPARGTLPMVRRMELGLREYGPTPFPAYKEAAVVGVRAALLYDIDLDADDLDLAEQIAAEVDADDTDSDTPEDGAVGRAEEPLAEHSSGYHRHRLYQLQLQERCAQAGIVLPGKDS